MKLETAEHAEIAENKESKTLRPLRLKIPLSSFVPFVV
jgi:hypothetical protein